MANFFVHDRRRSVYIDEVKHGTIFKNAYRFDSAMCVIAFIKDSPLPAFQATFPPYGGQEKHVGPQLPLPPFMGERDRGKGGLSQRGTEISILKHEHIEFFIPIFSPLLQETVRPMNTSP